MKCISCEELYDAHGAGTCKKCYDEANETEEELKREIDNLKAKVAFLNLSYPYTSPLSFSDVVLVASTDASPVPVQAHKAVLASRSPVFRAMLDNQVEESLSGTIKIRDVSYDALRTFVKYLYTAEICLDEEMACDLLILAEKYQVQYLKDYCQKFMVSKLNWDNSIMSYSFAHQHNAKNIIDAALSLITDNMDKLTSREDYSELVEKDPKLVVQIYEAYLSKQINTAAQKNSTGAADLAGNSALPFRTGYEVVSPTGWEYIESFISSRGGTRILL